MCVVFFEIHRAQTNEISVQPYNYQCFAWSFQIALFEMVVCLQVMGFLKYVCSQVHLANSPFF